MYLFSYKICYISPPQKKYILTLYLRKQERKVIVSGFFYSLELQEGIRKTQQHIRHASRRIFNNTEPLAEDFYKVRGQYQMLEMKLNREYFIVLNPIKYIEHLICARHSARLCHLNGSFNPQNTLRMVLTPSYKRSKAILQGEIRNLTQITQ